VSDADIGMVPVEPDDILDEVATEDVDPGEGFPEDE